MFPQIFAFPLQLAQNSLRTLTRRGHAVTLRILNVLRQMLYCVSRSFLAPFSFLRHVWAFGNPPGPVQHKLPNAANLGAPLFQSGVYTAALDLANDLQLLSFQHLRYLHFVRRVFPDNAYSVIHEHATGAWHQMSTVLKGLRTVPEHYAQIVLSPESFARANVWANRIRRMNDFRLLREHQTELAGSLVAATGRFHKKIIHAVMDSMSLQERVHLAIAAIGVRTRMGVTGELPELLSHLRSSRPTPRDLRAVEPALNEDPTITDAFLQAELNRMSLEQIFALATEHPCERRTEFFLQRTQSLFNENLADTDEEDDPLPELIQAACRFCAEKWGQGLSQGSLPLDQLIIRLVTRCINNYDRVEAALKSLGFQASGIAPSRRAEAAQGAQAAPGIIRPTADALVSGLGAGEEEEEPASIAAQELLAMAESVPSSQLAIMLRDADPLLEQTGSLTDNRLIGLLVMVGRERRESLLYQGEWLRTHIFAYTALIYRLSESEVIVRHTQGMSPEEVQAAFTQASAVWARSTQPQAPPSETVQEEFIEEAIIEEETTIDPPPERRFAPRARFSPQAFMRPACTTYAEELAKTLGALCTKLLLSQEVLRRKTLEPIREASQRMALSLLLSVYNAMLVDPNASFDAPAKSAAADFLSLPSVRRIFANLPATETPRTVLPEATADTLLSLPQMTLFLTSLSDAEASFDPIPRTAESMLAMLCAQFSELDRLVRLCPCYRHYLISMLKPQQYIDAINRTSIGTTRPPQDASFIERSRAQDEQTVRRAIELLELFIWEIQKQLLLASENIEEMKPLRSPERQNLQLQEIERLQAQAMLRLQLLAQQISQVEIIPGSPSVVCSLLLAGIDHFLNTQQQPSLAQRRSPHRETSVEDRLFLEEHALRMAFRNAFCSDLKPQPRSHLTIQWLQQIGLLQSLFEGSQLPQAMERFATGITSYVPREARATRFEHLQIITAAMEQLATQTGHQNADKQAPDSADSLFMLMQHMYRAKHMLREHFPGLSSEIAQGLQNQVSPFTRLTIYDAKQLAEAFVTCHFRQLSLCFSQGQRLLRKEIKDLLSLMALRIYDYGRSYPEYRTPIGGLSAEDLLANIETHSETISPSMPYTGISNIQIRNLELELLDPAAPRLRQLLTNRRELVLEILQENLTEIAKIYENGN